MSVLTTSEETSDGAAFTPNGAILVTGGAGFIGSHVVDALAAEYPRHSIVVLDRMDYCASRKTATATATTTEQRQRRHTVRGDVRDVDLVTRILEGGGRNWPEVDTVLHFASLTHVDRAFDEGNSLEFSLVNVCGTHALLEACRRRNSQGGRAIRRIVHVSTDEVYGDDSSLNNCENAPLREDHSRMAPTNPYSAAKAGAEMMCCAYITAFDLPILITRGNNVYGPRQFPEKLVPKFVMRAARGAPLPIHGDGRCRRSYLYVDDVARAFLTVLRRGRTGEVYNIGSASERSVLEVTCDIMNVMAHEKIQKSSIRFVEDRPFNDGRYFVDTSKLQALGWTETVSWEDGLRRTVEWYLREDWTEHWEPGAVRSALGAL